MQEVQDNGQMIPEGDVWGLEEEKQMPAETIKEFEDMIERAFCLDAQIQEIMKMEVDPLKVELKKLDEVILATLKKFNKTSYRGNAGMVVKTEKFSVKFPKNPDDKHVLSTFMGEDTYFDLASINFQSFNAWCKEKYAEAAEKQDLNFRIPGCETPTYVEYLSRRK